MFILVSFYFLAHAHGQNRGRVHKKQTRVAFTSRMFEDATNLEAGDAIPYAQEVVDTANAFENNTFTAPTSGLYFFTWSVTSLPNNPVDTSLMKGTEEIGKLSCHNFSNGVKRNTCAQSTLAQLRRNDTVWVSAAEAMSRVSGTYWPTFSGYKL